MKKFFISILVICSFTNAQSWKPTPIKLMTTWGENVSPANVLSEYPRPQFVRGEWKNLNGLWDYSIRSKFLDTPKNFDGKILVPFAIESALSGVDKKVGKENILWYKTNFEIPKTWQGKNIILHFGAVDWQTEVFINNKKVGEHTGGYDEFSFDVTEYLINDKEQELVLSVWDPIDDGFQPRGKQVKKPGGIWYTSVTGIWQTVWIEPVNSTYIESIKNYPDIDKNELTVEPTIVNLNSNDQIELILLEDGKEVKSIEKKGSVRITISINSPKLWSPSSPYLYDIKIILKRDGKILDEVKSYFGMRKISVVKDEKGIPRLMLNNKFLFQFGTLDQGWWPDGLYTAPSDEALAYDIVQLKNHGFNLIRKHVKVEPARYYYHCDKLGILVWQDMPSGDGYAGYVENSEIQRNAQSEFEFDKELKSIIDNKFNFPSIITWVPFNEGWGQFNTFQTCSWISHYDNSRLVDGPSGWSDFVAAGNIQDKHDYPGPSMPEYKNDNRALVLGEFGGLGLPIENHTWKDKESWGYRSYKNNDELQSAFIALLDKIPALINNGLSAAVYTQTTDVESEVNGLMTYDRKIIKMNSETIKKEVENLYNVK